MANYIQTIAVTALPIVGILSGSPATAKDSIHLLMLAQEDTQQYDPGAESPAEVPQEPSTEPSSEPPGGSQDEPGGVEAQGKPDEKEGTYATDSSRLGDGL